MNKKSRSRFGVDLGGVMTIDHRDCGGRRFGDPRFKTAALQPNVCQALRRLVDQFGQENVFIISRMNKVQGENAALAWLVNEHIIERTGILLGNVRFCRRREEKAGLCRTLGITHFVDNQPEVVAFLESVVPHRFLFQPRLNNSVRLRRRLQDVQTVYHWRELIQRFGLTLGESAA